MSPELFKLPLVAAIALLLATLPASADSLSYEAGAGFYFSERSKANFLRYHREAEPLFGYDSFYEVSYASWNGPDHAEAVGLARGIRLEKNAGEYPSISLGLSRISRTTSNLGQPFEFYGRLAYEKKWGKALLAIGWTHYSDAKFLFQWSGPNNAENFATVSMGMLF